MRETINHLTFWDDELADLDWRASQIFGKAAVLKAIARVLPNIEDITRGNILLYRQTVKTELHRMIGPP